MDVSRHDTNFALIGGDNSGAVGTDQPGFGLPEEPVLNSDHIMLGNTFGDTNDEWNFGFDGF